MKSSVILYYIKIIIITLTIEGTPYGMHFMLHMSLGCYIKDERMTECIYVESF